jgi:hypothetical protein
MESGSRPLPALRRLICARCGAGFDCRLGGDCWCAAETFRMPMPETGAGEDCLCSTCLRAAASTASN